MNPFLAPAEEPLQPVPSPPIWPWFIAYCVVTALMYFVLVIGCVVLFFIDPDLLREGMEDSTSALEVKIMGAIYLAISLPLFIMFTLGPILPRRPWVWIYNLILICIGMSSICCLPVTIPLLIFWLKEETQLFFGRTPRQRAQYI